MTENPYNSPNSDVESDSKSHRPGSIWKGILFGGLADIGATMVMGTIMGIIYLVLTWSPDMTPKMIEEAMNQYVEDSSNFNNIWSFIGLGFGLGFSVLGGYVCAIFARERWKKATLILAVILSAYGLLTGGEYYQLGVLLALILISIIAIYFGGWLRAGKRY